MTETRKIRLFILEGETDVTALDAVLENAFEDNLRAMFCTTGGDVTSDNNNLSIEIVGEGQESVLLSSVENDIAFIIKEWIKSPERSNSIRVQDIAEIVQITDTDAGFISDELVIEDRNAADEADVNIVYDTAGGCIRVRNKMRQLRTLRHERKQVGHLIRIGTLNLDSPEGVTEVPYRIFYMSCNLEHVLHDRINIPRSKERKEKTNLAKSFKSRFGGDSASFIKFISESDFAVKGTYEETWAFISDVNHPTRSLNRHTNLNVLFDNDGVSSAVSNGLKSISVDTGGEVSQGENDAQKYSLIAHTVLSVVRDIAISSAYGCYMDALKKTGCLDEVPPLEDFFSHELAGVIKERVEKQCGPQALSNYLFSGEGDFFGQLSRLLIICYEIIGSSSPIIKEADEKIAALDFPREMIDGQYIRRLRNAVVHGHFTTESDGAQNRRIVLWDQLPGDGEETARFSFDADAIQKTINILIEDVCLKYLKQVGWAY